MDEDMDMNEIVPGLWIGDFRSALNARLLKENNIYSILSVIRGKVNIDHVTFVHRQIMLDDMLSENALVHFLPSIAFIQKELDKGAGVLVHCQAGISRSPTIVAAYLMYSQNLDNTAALKLIRESRPFIEPNDAFLTQLEIFHNAVLRVSQHDKGTRMFYTKRAVAEILSGDGSLIKTGMLAKLPHILADSAPATPGRGPWRRIRCKMCRQELATQDHILDHGQLDPRNAAATTPAHFRQSPTTQLDIRRSSSTLSRSPLQPSSPFTSSGLAGEFFSVSALDAKNSQGEADALLEQSDQLAASSPPAGVAMTQPGRQSMLTNLPILAKPKCSGYFIEPTKWMEPFLESGQVAGKIFCPNKKCGAKLGNYDWAGVHCGCREWVIPGFCINRSKVDEVV